MEEVEVINPEQEQQDQTHTYVGLEKLDEKFETVRLLKGATMVSGEVGERAKAKLTRIYEEIQKVIDLYHLSKPVDHYISVLLIYIRK